MALHISSLNSGSNGNCYYLANEEDAILVDVGLNCRETEKRMARLGLSMSKVRAIFISHEHLLYLRLACFLPVKRCLYITPDPAGGVSRCRLTCEFKLMNVSALRSHIPAFPKLHDASEPLPL